MTRKEFQIKRIEYEEICEVGSGSSSIRTSVVSNNTNDGGAQSSVLKDDKRKFLLILFGENEGDEQEKMEVNFTRGSEEMIHLITEALNKSKPVYFSKSTFWMDSQTEIRIENKKYLIKCQNNWLIFLSFLMITPIFLMMAIDAHPRR